LTNTSTAMHAIKFEPIKANSEFGELTNLLGSVEMLYKFCVILSFGDQESSFGG